MRKVFPQILPIRKLDVDNRIAWITIAGLKFYTAEDHFNFSLSAVWYFFLSNNNNVPIEIVLQDSISSIFAESVNIYLGLVPANESNGSVRAYSSHLIDTHGCSGFSSRIEMFTLVFSSSRVISPLPSWLHFLLGSVSLCFPPTSVIKMIRHRHFFFPCKPPIDISVLGRVTRV